MNILIIEDEAAAASRLKRLVTEIASDADIIGEADSVEAAVKLFRTIGANADLVFMDIQLADGLSFEIFEKTTVQAPVIFTTAYDEYALKAFKINALDYLLKPIDRMELMLALEKFRKNQPTAVESFTNDLAAILKSVAQQKPAYRQRFLVNWREEFVPVSVTDVAYFVTDGGISWLVRADSRRFVVDETLEEIAAALDPGVFFRLNRQLIARPEAIRQIHKHFNGKLKITLQPNLTQEVFVSRDTAPEFRAWLNR